MGYTANFIAISALLPLPFAGYYLAAEIYAYSQQMGITLMGGIFAWLFIIQAVLIGTLFLSANYYLWCGMGRSDGAVIATTSTSSTSPSSSSAPSWSGSRPTPWCSPTRS